MIKEIPPEKSANDKDNFRTLEEIDASSPNDADTERIIKHKELWTIPLRTGCKAP